MAASTGRQPGRPLGSRNRKTRAIADKAAAEGITPLEVMIEAMRALHKVGKLSEAAVIARDAAPYMHPRLSSVESKVTGELVQRVISAEPLSDDEWESRYGSNLAATARPPESLN